MLKNWGVSALVSMSLVVAACQPAAPANDGPIRIGGAFAITGDLAVLDGPSSNGAILAAEEINAAGGVLGRPIELVVRDTQYKQDVTAQVARQFVEEDKVVGVVGFSDTDSVLAAGPIVQQAGLPFVVAGATSPKIPSQVGSNLFLACFGDNVQAAAGADYGFKTYGSTAYLLWDKGVEYTTLLGDYFKQSFTGMGGTIVLEDSYEDDATDFSPQIAKLLALAEQPDFYYIAAMPNNVGAVVKQMRDAGLTGPIIGGDGYDDPTWVAAVGDAANNVYFTTHALNAESGGSDAYARFYAAYNAKYGRPPENAFAGLGYDSVYLLVDAIKRANSTDPAAIISALGETSAFQGVTGAISFNSGVQVPQKGVTIIALRDGAYTLAAEVVPDAAVIPAP